MMNSCILQSTDLGTKLSSKTPGICEYDMENLIKFWEGPMTDDTYD